MRTNRFIGSAVARTLPVALALFGAACAANPAPVPLIGEAGAIARLTGEWVGEYRSLESGRSGSILFQLQAGRDTAVGDVLMIPADRPGPHPKSIAEAPRSEVIGIRFVSVADGTVRGQLDPYNDPGCGCRLVTTFSGTIQGDTIRGTYSSRHLEGGITQSGEWRVARRRGSG